MYTYRTTYTTAIDPAAAAALGTMMMTVSLIGLAIAVIEIIALWKVFTKAGKPGWASLIPFYNMYTLFQVAGMNGWMFLLTFIPIANVVILIMLGLNLAKAFGKSNGFAVGLILLSPIFMMILAFSNAQYVSTSTQSTIQ